MNKKTRRLTRTLPLLVLLLLSAATAAAAQAEGNPPNWCRHGAFTEDAGRHRLARVTGAPVTRAHFYADSDGCPKPGTECRAAAYLVPGDLVVVSRRFGDWACTWFQPESGPETVGWIEASRLAAFEFPQPRYRTPHHFWIGGWEYGRNFIDIRAAGGRRGLLSVEGQAYWQGLGDNVHVGEFNVQTTPSGSTMTLEDDTCRVKLRLVGRFLVVDDNGQCGGVNVTFDGVYRRKFPSRTPRR